MPDRERIDLDRWIELLTLIIKLIDTFGGRSPDEERWEPTEAALAAGNDDDSRQYRAERRVAQSLRDFDRYDWIIAWERLATWDQHRGTFSREESNQAWAVEMGGNRYILHATDLDGLADLVRILAADAAAAGWIGKEMLFRICD